MDFTSHGYFHPQSLYTASAGVGENTSSYGKCKSNPFADNSSSSIPDPLCKLNLKETSEFVRSLPMANEDPKRRGFMGVSSSSSTTCSSSALRRREGVSSVTVSQRKLESPPAGNLPSRKSFPSKWDDAERWLITTTTSTTSSHDSHKRLTSHSSNIVPKQCDSFVVDKTQQRTAVEEVFIADKVPTKLVPLSFRGTQSLAGAFHNGVVVSSASEDVLLKDKLMHEAEPVLPILRYSEEPMKEGFIFRNSAGEAIKDVSSRTVQVHHNEVECRDIGTEMTPLGSSTTSRCHTPFKSSSPARNNTPASRSGPLAFANPPIDLSHLHDYHLAKLQLGETQYDSVASYWSSREEEEEDVSKSLRHFETGNEFCTSSSISESRFSLWEEEERMKNCLRYQREEAKIQAWVNLQSAKAEAQSKKLEMKIQKMRSNLEEKLMKRMGVVHRKAEEWRSTAQLQHAEQIRKVGEQAQRMINHDNSHSLAHTTCGCFPCTNHHF